MAEAVARRRRAARATVVAAPPTSGSPRAADTTSGSSTPFLLDFFPLEEPRFTRLSAFFDALRRGKLTTTRCRKDSLFHWPPRVACPRCHTTELEWVDLPSSGHVYAFSAVLAGAPLGMEKEVPFVVGLVDLDGAPLRLFGRIVGTPWTECRVGMPVKVEPFEQADGRVFYRFRAGN